jgi:ABC-type transport system involved in multi-copper enzyme maturation permease subunit
MRKAVIIMLKTLIMKELRSIILSPKFAATFGICTILILLSVMIGIKEYRAAVKQYETASQLTDQQLREATGLRQVITKAYRKPNPMQVFVSGLSYDIGRYSPVDDINTVKLKGSTYSEDTIFAVFRFIDFAFIVQVILSLFAILFTYDTISGEREDGTLRLVFANAIPKAKFLLSKSIGAWLGLVVPISIPVLLGILMVVVMRVPFESADWVRLIGLLGLSLLYFTFFIILGVMLSASARTASVSFLLGLVCWVFFVLVIPRAGTAAAGHLVPIPSIAEIDSIRDGYAKDRMNNFSEEISKAWEKWVQEDNASGAGSDSVAQEDLIWKRIEQQDSARKEVEKEIEAYGARLNEDYQQKKKRQERLALTLSRFSPASAFQLGAMTLADNDPEMKNRYEETIRDYRTSFNDYKDNTLAKSGKMMGAIMISFDSENGLRINAPRPEDALDVSGLPQFSPPTTSLDRSFLGIAVDVGLLLMASFIAFGVAFMLFLRYDVR